MKDATQKTENEILSLKKVILSETGKNSEEVMKNALLNENVDNIIGGKNESVSEKTNESEIDDEFKFVAPDESDISTWLIEDSNGHGIDENQKTNRELLLPKLLVIEDNYDILKNLDNLKKFNLIII